MSGQASVAGCSSGRIERYLQLFADNNMWVACCTTPANWVQEEPLNQGAWPFLALNLPGKLTSVALQVRARQPASAPATGSGRRHEAEQTALIESAFAV